MMKHDMRYIGAVLLALLMVLPGIPAVEESGRIPPNIVFNTKTFADGNESSELVFAGPDNDTSLGLSLPNGATVLDARMNISGAPLTKGGTDCPRNLSVDVGRDGVQDWAFRGKGYGDMGHQYEFPTGENASQLRSGADNSSTSIIHLPAGARVTGASCNVSSLGVTNTVTVVGGNIAVQSPFNIGQYRMQWLYLASEIGRSGMLDKIGWKVYSGTGSGTLSNFKLFLGHTPLMNTSDTFDDNWGGEKPTKVIDADSYIYSDVDGWITIDFPNVYSYNNTLNLLIELSFSARAGTNYLLTFGYLGAGAGTRRLYNNVDYTSATGILDNPDSALHYDARFDFAEGFCMTVDLYGDSVPDYINDKWDWNVTTLEFAQTLDSFMRTAPVNHTDGYGNQFARVPIVVSTEGGGGVQISNLSITYEYTAVVKEHPVYLDLTEVLNNLLPYEADGNFTTIPILVSSVRAGRVRLSNLSIDFRPPIHDPDIDSRDPATKTVVMNENESRLFAIQASDEWGYPLSTVWYVDTLETVRDVYNITFSPDFDSAGNHEVRVTVDNTLRTVNVLWNITVLNVNRPPVVNEFSPGAQVTIREEESVNLAVTASDPDSQDTELRYNWYVNNADQGISDNSFRFKTDLRSAGEHTIRVKVTDTGGLSVNRSWQVTVLNVNVPPAVDSISPNMIPFIRETESVAFSVTASDFDKQVLTYRWYLDGAEVGNGQQYVYRTGYDDAGEHTVKVVISDGEANVTRDWTVTVENVNRAPLAVIGRPAGLSEFNETDTINFSALSSSDPDKDALRYRWLEGNRELATTAEFERQFTHGVHEVTLEVTDTNRAVHRATVKFTVRYVKLKTNIEWDLIAPVEGNRLTFTAWVNNTGDARAASVAVEFLVDGASLGTQTIDEIAGGGTGSATFGWKAKKGEHALAVKIGGQSWNSTLSVAKRPAPPPADLNWIYIVGAVAAAAAVGGGAMLLSRSRKKGGRAEAAPPAATVPPEAAAPEPVAPKERTKTVPEKEAPPAPSPAETGTRDRARQLINSTQERIADLLENEEEGIDVAPAMATLEKAQAALKAGKPAEALRLAEQAGASLAVAGPPKEGPPEKAVGPKSLKCANCGEELEPGWGVCPVCGHKN